MKAIEPTRYFAFISYSHQDELWASWLHKALETYRVPSRLVGQTTAAGIIPRRLLPIFRDRSDLASATDLSREVDAALAQSANLIVICSPTSAASRWVNQEILAFKRLAGGERVFCLIVGGEPNATGMPGRESEECFAPALRYTLGADGEPTAVPTEPIAADARVGKDGKANAKLKLIAGMLDVGFDALKQRELQRRNRRMAIVTAAALLIMAITTTLAITAAIARHDAERRQKQAEDLVDFMLGDLNDKLQQVHRLDILQAVDDQAMAYFAALPIKDVTEAALTQRVTALEKIGGVRLDQGQVPAALEAYNAASALAAEIAQRNPADMAAQAAYADSLKWVGQAHWYRGDLTEALQKFQAARDLLQQIFAAKPDDNELAFKLAAARNNVGHVLETRGDLAASRTEYEATKKIYETLSQREPANPRWRSRLGDAYNNLGKLALAQGQIEQAIGAYRADQRIKVAVAQADPDNHDVQENLLLINAILGRTLGLCGEMGAAERYTTAAIDTAKKLMGFDATYVDWQEYFGLYSQQLGGLLRQEGRLDEAALADAEAVRVLAGLVKKDGTRADWQQELAQAQLESADLRVTKGNLDAARDLLESAQATIEQLQARNSGNRALVLLAARTQTLYGEIAASRGDGAKAREHWLRARDTVAAAAQTGDDPTFLAAWATPSLLLGDTDGARPVVDRLSKMGYRAPDFVALVVDKNLNYPADDALSGRIADSIR